MSQQPPYGAPPPPPPGGPYQPYGGGYPPQPQQPDHTARNVILIILAVVLVFCAGLVFVIIRIVNAVGDGIDAAADAFDTSFEGSSDDPLTVTEGDAFTIRGFDYDAGWKVGGNGITGVRATNDRSDEDSESVRLAFHLIADNEVVATVSCTPSDSVPFERSLTLTCTDTQVPATYDEIEVYDNSVFE